MTAIQWIGAAILALPFVGLAVFIVHSEGWKALGVIYGATAALVAICFAGSYLLTGGL